MSVMKQVVQNLSLRKKDPNIRQPSVRTGAPRSPKAAKSSGHSKKIKTAVHQPLNTYEAAEKDENIHKPAPTEFVSWPV